MISWVPPWGGRKGVFFFFGNSQRKMPPPLFDPPKGGPMMIKPFFTISGSLKNKIDDKTRLHHWDDFEKNI